MIDLIAPCMDEYLYIIDLNNDTLRISQSAVERFMLPDKFMNDATRNPAIARAFAYMKIIEKWGTGIPRLFEASYYSKDDCTAT